jgi:hypothetical protein
MEISVHDYKITQPDRGHTSRPLTPENSDVAVNILKAQILVHTPELLGYAYAVIFTTDNVEEPDTGFYATTTNHKSFKGR